MFSMFILFAYIFKSITENPGGGGVLPYMGYIGMCRGIGYGFWRFSILK